MKKHYLKLNNEPFNLIKQQIKTVEMRLNDEKRKVINIGDIIEFTNITNNETINCLVTNIKPFDDFEKLYQNYEKTTLGYIKNYNNNSYLDMYKYYTKEDIKKYGTLAIEIKLITKEIIDLDSYQSFTKITCNHELNQKETLITGVMGLCGESGEVIDIVKKWYAQGHDLDPNKIKDELGDVCWYISCICNALDININEVFQTNIDKLKKRYPNGFTIYDSINRDK